MDTKLKYFIYCRKSSEQKDRQALSIEAQERELMEFATKEKLQIIKVFEESQSAYKLGRPIFDKMMKLVEENVADAILTWKPDRLARNAIDGGRIIQALDEKKLQEIRTPYEIFRQEDTRMMVYIHFGMSNDYSRQISANVKRGNRQKYERGEFCGKAPLGYLNQKVGISNNIILDSEKAPLVKRLFEEFSSGKYSVIDMVNKADSWGLRSFNGNKIAKSGMYTLLRRSAYYGVYKHAGDFHQGNYEPLISKGLFDLVQLALSDRTKPRKKEWTHEYTNLIKCGECGCSITASTKSKYYKRTNNKKSYTYYHCTKKRGKCRQKPITSEELQEMFDSYLGKICIDSEVWELGIELLKAKHINEIEQNTRVSKDLDMEKVKIGKELGKLLTMRLDEEIGPLEYAEAKKILLDKKIEIEQKQVDREHSSENWLELAENFFETAFQAREIIDGKNVMQKRDLIKAVGSDLFLKDKKLEFSFRKPFDVLLKPEVRKDVQGWKESNFRFRFWRPKSYH